MVGPLLKPNNTEQNSYPFHDHTCILKLMINDLVNRNICVTYDLEYIMFVVITIRSFAHSHITGFMTRGTRRVSHVDQELPTLPEHRLLHPIFIWVRADRFYIMVCTSLFVLMSFSFSFLLRFTVADQGRIQDFKLRGRT